VDAAAHLEMEAFHAVADGPRRPDRGRGRVERARKPSPIVLTSRPL